MPPDELPPNPRRPRVLRRPAAGEAAVVVAELSWAARHALPAFGLRAIESPGLVVRAGEAVVTGPAWAFDDAARRAGPAREAAAAMSDALRRAARETFAVAGPRPLELGRPVVMAVVNVTPDSFSDGGKHESPAAAREVALARIADGAAIVDVGGESTRPGAAPVAVAEELRRVVPAIRAIAEAAPDARISVDTLKAQVARAAVEAGASMVNDVSGLDADPAMAEAVAALGVPLVLGHRRGDAGTMQSLARYEDVVAEVVDELGARADRALAAGIAPDRILVDPGLGFAKRGEHNWALLARLEEVRSLGYPIVVGPSRKAFLGAALATTGAARPPSERDDATLACAVIAALAGAKIVRVHAAARCADALAVVAVLRAAEGPRA